jgi:hypothetical protein
VEFALVDKDDVLGLFAAYGLTVGVDVLELGKFVITMYVPEGSFQDNMSVEAPVSVMAGLYLRLIYHSVGTTDPIIAPTYKWHEV